MDDHLGGKIIDRSSRRVFLTEGKGNKEKKMRNKKTENAATPEHGRWRREAKTQPYRLHSRHVGLRSHGESNQVLN